MELISSAQLRKICPLMGLEFANQITAAINEVCPQYGMNVDILHEFLANTLHESKEFTDYEENLNYSAERMVQVWPSRFRTVTDAQPYARNPHKLANKVYGGRLGNTQPTDGWDFRGSGPIQMTGREHFTNFSLFMRRKFNVIKTAQEWAELIRRDHRWAMHSACWIFSIAKGLNDEAMNDQMRVIVKRINGGYIGESDRMKYYEVCKRYIPIVG